MSRIGIKNETVKENVPVSLHRRQNQNSFPSVAVHSLWRLQPWLSALSQGKRPSDVADSYQQKETLFLYRQLETEWNSWITTRIKKWTWGTGYEGKCACLTGNCHVRLIKNCDVGGNWHAWLPEKYYYGLSSSIYYSQCGIATSNCVTTAYSTLCLCSDSYSFE